MSTTPSEVIDRIERSGMYSAEDLEVLRQAAMQLPPEITGERFIQDLQRQGWLTEYQGELIITDSAKPLVLGNYLILDEIGRGGMGIVLKGRHRKLKRTVALKVITDDFATDEDTIRRFQREIATAGGLDHPNIVTAYDADEVDGTHFLVMEHVEGRTLADILIQDGPPPLPVGVDWMVQAARGMGYAHARGVVHRDLKPGNLFLDRDGKLKIMDLGLARWLSEVVGDVSSLTASYSLMGTMDYLAPEQAEDAKTAGKEADIYSLGMTMFHVLTGEKPYPEDTLTKSILAHREKPIPKMGDHREHIPVELEMLFSRMAAKNPKFRSLSMTEIAAALERIKADVEGRPGWERALQVRYEAGVEIGGEDSVKTQPPADVDSEPPESAEAESESDTWGEESEGEDSSESIVVGNGRRNLMLMAAVAIVSVGLTWLLMKWRSDRPLGSGGEGRGSGGPLALERLDGVNRKVEWDQYPFVLRDGLALYFERGNAIYRAARPDFEAPFEETGKILDLGRHPAVTADELCLIALLPESATSMRGRLAESRRKSVDEPFPPLKPVSAMNSDNGVKSPWISSDGLTLVYQRSRAERGTGSEFAFTSREDRNSPWKPAVPLPMDDPLQNGSGTWPKLSEDLLTIWLSIPGHEHHEFFKGTRPNLSSPFGNYQPVRIGEYAPAGKAPSYCELTDELFFSAPDPREEVRDINLFVIKNISSLNSDVPQELREVSFRYLFNGKNLDGWRNYEKGAAIDPSWRAEDGILAKSAETKKQHIMTTETFGDFILRWSWRIPKDGNSGVEYFILDKGDQPRGHEFQMIDDINYKKGRFNPKGLTGSLWNILPAYSRARVKPHGEWNTSRIIVSGTQVQHFLNGALALKYELGGAELRAALRKRDREKFPLHGAGGKVRGHILLNDNGTKCEFKDIRIMEF